MSSDYSLHWAGAGSAEEHTADLFPRVRIAVPPAGQRLQFPALLAYCGRGCRRIRQPSPDLSRGSSRRGVLIN